MDTIEADWPAPGNVRAVATTRRGGVSPAPYDSLNLGAYTRDDPAHVTENRQRVVTQLGLPEMPRWLSQVHGREVVAASDVARDATKADAQWTAQPGTVLAVLTADCLPVVIVDASGAEVAAAHAGWRGLASGVLAATVATFRRPASQLMAWLGPAIGPADYEVDATVRDAFTAVDAGSASAFEPSRHGRWQCDLYALARQRLAAAGVSAVYGGGWSTAEEPQRFFSHRREGATGRMACLIWRTQLG